MNSNASYILERQDHGVCRLSLNRPNIHNAFDDRLILDLTNCLDELGRDEAVRVLVLTGVGTSFSAGADLNWMRRSANYDEAENLTDARALARLMSTLYSLPKATIARVNGTALGGGVGLICCCDIAIASDHAKFGTTEVRLGIMPSVIGPYVMKTIGQRHARRIMLTGERFDAAEALRIGLVHEVLPEADLDDAVHRLIHELLKSGPNAILATKRLIHDLGDQPMSEGLTDETARRIAKLRSEPEAKEGLSAFLQKRSPAWRA